MLEFEVNELITLRLEDGKTNIYFNGRLFRQCKSIILNIPKSHFKDLDDIKTINEAVERLHKSSAGRNFPSVTSIIIPPEVEFWGHCSNIQAWAEHNYDTSILDYRLSFPLLKKMTLAGDINARRRLKSEVVKRMESGSISVIFFLLLESYLTFFNKEEESVLWELIFKKLESSLEQIFQKGEFQSTITFLTLDQIIKWYRQQAKRAEGMLKSAIKAIFEKGHQNSIHTLIDNNYFRNYFKSIELMSILLESNSPITQKLLDFFYKNPQFKDDFDREVSKRMNIDKKRGGLTTASEYIIDIILLTMESDYCTLSVEFNKFILDI